MNVLEYHVQGRGTESDQLTRSHYRWGTIQGRNSKTTASQCMGSE